MSEKKNMTGKENSFHMENFRRRSRYAAVFLVLILAFAAITVLNINSGNVNISIPEIFRILLRRTGEGKEYNIIWKIRLPRILMAAILGGALSLSGFLLQTFFENPIAGPFVLGISSGAKMVVALTMIFYLEWARNITSYTMIVAAFLGSLLSVGFILLMSRRIKNMAGVDRLHLLGGHGFCCHLRGGFRYRQPPRLVTGKLLRHELEQRSDLCGCDRHHLCHHVPDGKTDRCIPAR